VGEYPRPSRFVHSSFRIARSVRKAAKRKLAMAIRRLLEALNTSRVLKTELSVLPIQSIGHTDNTAMLDSHRGLRYVLICEDGEF
jgi:hypothetical protein